MIHCAKEKRKTEQQNENKTEVAIGQLCNRALVNEKRVKISDTVRERQVMTCPQINENTKGQKYVSRVCRLISAITYERGSRNQRNCA